MKIYISGMLLLIVLFFSSCSEPSGNDDTGPEDLTTTNKIYWVTWNGTTGTIKSADIENPGEPETVIDNLDYIPGQIQINSNNGKIYWMDKTNGWDIFWADLDGSGSEIIISETTINDFCIDAVNNKIYIAVNYVKILDANLDGSGLIDGLEINCGETTNIQSIAVDSSAGKLFWSTIGKIYKANIDGTGIEEIYNGDVQYDIELDTVNENIYFLPNLSINGVAYINFEGSDYHEMIFGNNPTTIYAIDLINEKFYFEMFDGSLYIKYCDMDGENINTFLQENVDWITGLAFEYE